jgi:hypothetical protein
MVVGVTVAALTGRVLSGRRVRDIMPGLLSRRVVLPLLLGLMAVPVVAVYLGPTMIEFISKRTASQDVFEAYNASRGRLIEVMLRNIDSNFFTGIGFGIGSEPEVMEITRDPVFGLPISAIVEKGVLPFAVFEELGLFGFSLFVLWVCTVVVQAARNGIVPLGLVLVFLLVNMGEATLFSPGGFGLIGLILITLGVTGGQPRALGTPYAARVARNS